MIQTLRGRRSRRISKLLTSTMLTGLAVIGWFASGATHARADSGNACSPLGWITPEIANSCAILAVAPDGSGGDHPGGTGQNGTTASNLQHDFATPLTDSNGNAVPYELILMLSQGGAGGAGADTDGGHTNGGNGGAGGAGGSITFSLEQGVNVDRVDDRFEGLAAVQLISLGGEGGEASRAWADYAGTQGTGGQGGDGGPVTVQGVAGTIVSQVQGVPAFVVSSIGGNGGNGQNYDEDKHLSASGANGGAGGNGESVYFDTFIAGASTLSITSAGAGLVVTSVGGGGGGGGNAESGSVGATGGNGGDGGNGSDISVTIADGSINAAGTALWIASIGGDGGTGGEGPSGGNGAIGGIAGNVDYVGWGNTLTVSCASSASSCDYSPGLLIQANGGAAGAGGSGGGWGGGGGSSNPGGTGGTIWVRAGGSITTDGDYSPGMLLQSVGGSGGDGGPDHDWAGGGGNGGAGGAGNSISVISSQAITTYGALSEGILAQSVGGGGGAGGNSSGGGFLVAAQIGGEGANGGDGGSVDLANSGVIETSGLGASGILLQSIGGGGGRGGAANSTSGSVAIGVAVAVGGDGGAGGDGDGINQGENTGTTNSGTILTQGSDAYGILAQSIGGGGGTGGASLASAYTGSSDDVPAASVSISIGGSGGDGGDGGHVTLSNTGLIATSGGGAAGLAGQSVGGGGGVGGDSSAAAYAAGADLEITATTALGGPGGTGGAGEHVTIDNAGLIVTAGESAFAILAQSIGGGGGNGGTGDGSAKSSAAKYSVNTTVTLGGSGGGGNGGGLITVTNEGGLLTLGDGADGILAQSIGGGGGAAGGAGSKASGSGTAVSTKVSIGGTGGSGGTGDAVTVTNSGAILTYGADASAIVAQSIGGGGGKGGKAAGGLDGSKTTGDGGNAANGDASTIIPAVQQNSGSVDAASTSGLLALANILLGNSTSVAAVADDGPASVGDLSTLSENGAGEEDSGTSASITLAVSVGGSGGSGGTGGEVTVSNAGSLATAGKLSDGILAQSIGGGGGKGGATNATATAGTVNGALSVGASGGSGGDSGYVGVDNSGSITTVGSLAAGIVAQSVGGGGGVGGKSGSSTAALQGLSVSIGGSGGSSGDAGTSGQTDSAGRALSVFVNNSGDITTASHGAAGIIAQAIGGGGGIIKTLATDMEATGGVATDSGQYQFDLTFGGSSGSSGDVNGAVEVTSSGIVTTTGTDAYGIVAQSIGGGGGLVLGGQPTGTDLFGTGSRAGDAGMVEVSVSNGGISTTGNGAVAIVAQSIGGGGGFGGEVSSSSQLVAFTGDGATKGSGNGGTVIIGLSAATVSTSGANASAVIAQSIGGGGGWITTDVGAVSGSAGGSGSGSAVGIIIDSASSVSASGAGSNGIFAESAGADGTGQVSVSVGSSAAAGGSVSGGSGSNVAGIYLRGGWSGQTLATANVVTNYGTISAASGTSIIVDGGFTFIENYGTLDGGPQAINGGGVHLDNSGTVNATSSITLGSGGQFINSGALVVGGAGTTRTIGIDGIFTQTAAGTILLDADHVKGGGDLLHISGAATIDGTIEVNPLSLSRNAVTLISSDSGLTLASSLSVVAAGNNHLFSYAGSSVDGTSLTVSASAHFLDDSASLSGSQRAVAAYLQRAWTLDDAGSLSAGYLQFQNAVADATSYGIALSGFAENAATMIGAMQAQASLSFVDQMNSCPLLGASGLPQEQDCVWARATVNGANVSSNAGFSQNATLLQTGVQKEIAQDWFLGGAIGVGWSSIAADNGIADADGTSFAAGAILKYQHDHWLFTMSGDGGYTSYDNTNRFTLDGTASVASTNTIASAYGGAHARIAYLQPVAGWTLKPYVDLHAFYGHTGGYTENGNSPLAMQVSSADQWRFAVAPMLEAELPISLGNGTTLEAFASAGGIFFNDNSWTTAARFLDAPVAAGTFEAETALPEQLAQVKAGARLIGAGAWDFKLEYAGTFGDGFSNNAGTMKINYRF